MYRPQYHFTPPTMWTNDPNGMVYVDGTYHLFYQHYPEDSVWGPMHWGHAVSKDLIHWEHLPIALYPDELGLIFSGSAVYDVNNTSGLGEDGKAPIVAIYTSHGETEQQSIAYSLDGIHFTKYEGNPVIPNTQYPDFRDPKVFWDTTSDCWGLILASGNRARIYHSPDLIHWNEICEFGPFSAYDGCVWECPDFFPLTAPDGTEYWVMLVSHGNVGDKLSGDTFYRIGTWDGSVFTPLEEDAIPVSFARDDYAGVTYYGAPERTYIGWATNWAYAKEVPTGELESFRGQMTLPRTLTLRETSCGLRLAAAPVGLSGLPVVSAGDTLPEAFTIKLTGESPCEILLSNGTDAFRAGIDAEGRVFMDRTGMKPASWSENFDRPCFADCRAERFETGAYDLTFVFDHSVAEIYADNGTRVGTMILYPETPFTELKIQ